MDREIKMNNSLTDAWTAIGKLTNIARTQNERIEALEKRVAELEAKVNQVHPAYCKCGKHEKGK